jgi:folylpolyglutamate synthase/dihydropteroate synthase
MPFTPELQRELSPAVLQTVLNAATWCSRAESSSNSFRSPELDPLVILDIPDFPHSAESIETWIEKKRDCYRRAVSWISHTRSKLLGQQT